MMTYNMAEKSMHIFVKYMEMDRQFPSQIEQQRCCQRVDIL